MWRVILSFAARTPNRGRVDEKWSELNKSHDILTVRTSVHALFAPLDHQKNETFFHREESGKRERRKCEKRRDRTSLLAAYQIHNTQALRFTPNDMCHVISLLADVTVLLMQADTSDFMWCMLQNLCV
jgi:hypothetical protein